MWNSIIKKKNNRVQQQTRQHQKMRTRTIFVLAASSLAFIAIGLTVFFHFSRVDKSSAVVQTPVAACTLDANILQFAKRLDAPVIKNTPLIGPNTILTRASKKVTEVNSQPGN